MSEYTSLPYSNTRILHLRAEDALEDDLTEVPILTDLVGGYSFEELGGGIVGPVMTYEYFPSGYPGLVFDSSSQYRCTDATLLSNLDGVDIDDLELTIIQVGTTIPQASSKAMWGIGNNATDYIGTMLNTSQILLLRNDDAGGHTAVVSNISVVTDDLYVFTSRIGGTTKFRANQTDLGFRDPDDMLGGITPNMVEINAYRAGNNRGFMTLGEFVIIGTLLNDSDVSKWETLLTKKYTTGLPSGLPARFMKLGQMRIGM